MRNYLIPTILATAISFYATQAGAQATRTWVSGVGDDVNPCSRTAPCKTFAGAISKTASGGEIDALDPGGFGAVTITKPITIDGGSEFASILASATNGIVVNIAAATPTPNGRNLSINGAGATLGLTGINVAGGAVNLSVQSVVIKNFSTTGLRFAPSNSTFISKLQMKDVTINNVAGGGVTIAPTSTTNSFADIDNLTVTRSGHGVRVQDRGLVTVANSFFSQNTGAGATVVTSAGGIFALLMIKNSVLAGNLAGISTSGASSLAGVTNTTINLNGTGISPTGGTINTFGNNQVFANTANGAFNGALAQQ